jgi:hypothetical protein
VPSNRECAARGGFAPLFIIFPLSNKEYTEH